MNLLAFISPRIVRALGWTLLHSLWQGALLALGLALVLLTARRASARARYASGIMLLALMVAVSGFTFWQSCAGALSVRPASVTAQAGSGTLAAAPTSRSPSWLDRSGAFFAGYFDRHLPLLVTLWLLGVLVLTLRLAGGLLFLQRLKSRQLQPLPEPWPERAAALSRRCGVRRPVAVWQSLRAKAPLIVGCFKPVVLLPVGMITGMAPQQVEALLAHELAHVTRHDYLVNTLQALVDILFFFHPGLRWISAQVRLERENCCDDIAVAMCGDPRDYARALADLHDNRRWRPEPALAATGRPQHLFGRIRRLFGRPATGSDFQAGFFGAVVLIACLLLLLKAPAGATTTLLGLEDVTASAGGSEPANRDAACAFTIDEESDMVVSGTFLAGFRFRSWIMDAETARIVWSLRDAPAAGNRSFSARVRLPAGHYVWLCPGAETVSMRRVDAPAGEALSLQRLAEISAAGSPPAGEAGQEKWLAETRERQLAEKKRQLQEQLRRQEAELKRLQAEAQHRQLEGKKAEELARMRQALDLQRQEMLQRQALEKADTEAGKREAAEKIRQLHELQKDLQRELEARQRDAVELRSMAEREHLRATEELRKSERELELKARQMKEMKEHQEQELKLKEEQLRIQAERAAEEAARHAAEAEMDVQARLLEAEKLRLELEEKAAAMEEGLKRIREEMRRDGLTTREDPEIRFSEGALFIDGRKQPPEVHKKYKKLFESVSGKKPAPEKG